MTSESEKILINQLRDINSNLKSLVNAIDSSNQILTFISHDLSINDNDKDIGIADILNQLKNQLKPKKEIK